MSFARQRNFTNTVHQRYPNIVTVAGGIGGGVVGGSQHVVFSRVSGAKGQHINGHLKDSRFFFKKRFE